jgi:O-antigen ligase
LARYSVTSTTAPLQYWLVAAFLVLVFLTGGSSRIDAQSFLILRPLSVVACGIALVTLQRRHFQHRELLFGGFAAIFALTALHIVPFPTSLMQPMSADARLKEIDRVAELHDIARSLTPSPSTGWQALTSLFIPLAVLLLGVQLSREHMYRLLPILIGMGSLSGLLGLLQIIGNDEGPLYFYQITNYGSAVGLFANRNHAAVLLACMFPMLATYARTGNSDDQNGRKWIAGGVAILLVPLILVTGSRSGLLIAIIGVLSGTLLYLYHPLATSRHPPSKGSRLNMVRLTLLMALAVIGLVSITISFSRAEAIDRLFANGLAEDQRQAFWAVSFELFRNYLPWGSGAGSFVEVFRAHEPSTLLGPTYINRAHNDWVETALTLGLPGLLLLSAAAYFFVRQILRLTKMAHDRRRSVAFSRLAAAVIAMIAVSSIFDYPMRTPTFMCIVALMTLWLTEPVRELKAGT